MSPVAICRYEGPKGEGPFSSAYDIARDLDALELPAPAEDYELRKFKSGTHFFGFTSEESALYWFTPHDLELMAKHGIRLVWYLVPPSAILWGEHQVAFVRDVSIRLN